MGGGGEEGREVEVGILTQLAVINRHVLTYTYSLYLMCTCETRVEELLYPDTNLLHV